jgi:hypothetical protein
MKMGKEEDLLKPCLKCLGLAKTEKAEGVQSEVKVWTDVGMLIGRS